MTNFWWRAFRARSEDDSGLGMVMVVLFVALAAAITTTLSSMVVDTLHTTTRDRQALGALSTAEGGVAQAVQVIRANAPGYFSCQEPAAGAAPSGACLTNPAGWTSSAAPEKVSSNGTVGSCVTGLACYQVWISTLAAYNPLLTTNAAGVPSHIVEYRIHSTGLSGGGPAARSLLVDISAKLAQFPFGVYGDTLSMNGSPAIHHESVFTLNCISSRNKVTFDSVSSGTYNGYDWASDEPQSAHSASYISTSGTCTSASSSIHTAAAPCNNSYPFDQDLAGGALGSGNVACYQSWRSPLTGTTYATTSAFSVQALYQAGYQPQGLTPAEYDALKQEAQAMGTYNPVNVSAALSAITSGTAVLYVDNADLTIGPGDVPSQFFRGDNSPSGVAPGGLASCGLNSLIVVVRNHNLMINSFGGQSGDLVASVFVPEGSYGGHGNAQILGTIFGQSLTLRGTQDFHLDQCFVNNPPSMLLDLQQVRYHEVDTQNIQ